MENGSITEIGILDASHETRQFLRRAKRLLTTVVEAQSWEVDAVSEATYTSRGILGAVQNALTGEVVNNPLPPQSKPAAPLVAEEFTAPSTYLDGIYTAEAMDFEGKITVQITVAEDKITDITLVSAEDEEEYLSRAKQVIPAILEGQSPNVDAVSGATLTAEGQISVGGIGHCARACGCRYWRRRCSSSCWAAGWVSAGLSEPKRRPPHGICAAASFWLG